MIRPPPNKNDTLFKVFIYYSCVEEPITIVDRDVLKVLSVDTRMDILKLLGTGERMPSFISSQLGKSTPTIIEHLDVLQRVGLVRKLKQPDNKFVFYSLTEKGEGILRSKSRRLVIILCLSILSFVGSLFFGFLTLVSELLPVSTTIFQKSEALVKPPLEPVQAPPSYGLSMDMSLVWLILAILLFVLAVIGFITYYRKRR